MIWFSGKENIIFLQFSAPQRHSFFTVTSSNGAAALLDSSANIKARHEHRRGKCDLQNFRL